jgi:hypothetical protein
VRSEKRCAWMKVKTPALHHPQGWSFVFLLIWFPAGKCIKIARAQYNQLNFIPAFSLTKGCISKCRITPQA